MLTMERHCGHEAPLPQRKSIMTVVNDSNGEDKACQIDYILFLVGSTMFKCSWRASKEDMWDE